MLYFLALCVLIPPFSVSKTLFSTLSSFLANVLLLSYSSILVLLMHFQLSPGVSNDHHAMIGIFLLSLLLISNISSSDTSHPGSYLPLLCVVI